MIISCVYFSNDILFVFMIAVATMDNNAEILRVIGHLREIGSPWMGGDKLIAACQILCCLLLIQSQDRMILCVASHHTGRGKGNNKLMG